MLSQPVIRKLREEHFEIEDGLDDLACIPTEKTKARRSKFLALKKLILHHLDREERLVYAPLLGSGKKSYFLKQVYSDRRIARYFLSELSRCRLDTLAWNNTLKELQEHLVRMHDEEESDVFEEYEKFTYESQMAQGLEGYVPPRPDRRKEVGLM